MKSVAAQHINEFERIYWSPAGFHACDQTFKPVMFSPNMTTSNVRPTPKLVGIPPQLHQTLRGTKHSAALFGETPPDAPAERSRATMNKPERTRPRLPKRRSTESDVPMPRCAAFRTGWLAIRS
jgi:hypothetical protein